MFMHAYAMYLIHIVCAQPPSKILVYRTATHMHIFTVKWIKYSGVYTCMSNVFNVLLYSFTPTCTCTQILMFKNVHVY